MVLYKMIRLCLLLLFSVCSCAWAQTDTVELDLLDESVQADFTKLNIIHEPEHLSRVKLVENRFRIDQYVDELILILFRDRATAPSILIRPDGSKLYASTIEKTQGDWFYAERYDMVRLLKPMPGPWQVVAQLKDKSEIMVMSDVNLEADKLPHILFAGETLSLNAEIKNGGTPIPYHEFSDVVRMAVTFVSTNNRDFDNFSADSVAIATFADDGLGFDKKRKDGIFSGEFKLDLIPGEWRPQLFVDLALFNREFSLDPVVVLPKPFKFEFVPALEANEQHQLHIIADSDQIDFSSFVFNGAVYYPNGDSESFAISEAETLQHTLKLYNYQHGVYRVKVKAFGKNINGRDMMLDLPEQSFTIAAPVAVVEETDIVAEEQTNEVIPPVEEEPEMSPGTLVLIAIFGNLLVLTIFIALYILKGKKSLSFSLPKIRFKKPAKKGKKGKSDEKSSETDDIIDLRMPEEI